MTKLYDLTAFVRLVLWTGWVEPEGGDKTVSAMLVSRFEAGKTSILNQFNDEGREGIVFVSDATEHGILTRYGDQLEAGRVKFLVIPDLIRAVSRKRSTVDSLITFLNILTEEGLGEIATYAMHFKPKAPVHAGVLTSIAIGDFERLKRRMTAVGFLSRFLVMSYDYEGGAIERVFADIVTGQGSWDKESLGLPAEPQRVYLPPVLARLMVPRAKEIGAKLHAYGFRAQHQFQQLARASALSSGRDTVTGYDVERVLHLSQDYLGLQYNKIGIEGVVSRQLPLDMGSPRPVQSGRFHAGDAGQ